MGLRFSSVLELSLHAQQMMYEAPRLPFTAKSESWFQAVQMSHGPMRGGK